MNRLVTRIRYLAGVAIAGMFVTMLVTFVLAIAKTGRVVDTLVDGGWRSDLLIVDLLEVVDSYLIGIVQLIVVIGLYELFIGSLDVPAWLRARTLDDLKKSIVDVLVVYIGVKGIERLASEEDPMDALTYTGAVAILIAALTLFRFRPSPSKSMSGAPAGSNDPGA